VLLMDSSNAYLYAGAQAPAEQVSLATRQVDPTGMIQKEIAMRCVWVSSSGGWRSHFCIGIETRDTATDNVKDAPRTGFTLRSGKISVDYIKSMWLNDCMDAPGRDCSRVDITGPYDNFPRSKSDYFIGEFYSNVFTSWYQAAASFARLSWTNGQLACYGGCRSGKGAQYRKKHTMLSKLDSGVA
jgi:hypothetical protein